MTPAKLIDMMKGNQPGILELVKLRELKRRADFYNYPQHIKDKINVPVYDSTKVYPYYDIKLLYDQEFVWLPEIDDEGNETIKKNFNSLAVWFWFPD